MWKTEENVWEIVKTASVTCGAMPKSQIFMSKNQNKMKKVQHNKNIWRHNDRKVPKFEVKLINLQIQ